MRTLVILSVVDIGLLIGALVFYLFVVGSQLTRVAGLLEDSAESVWTIKRNAELIEPGLERINNTGRVIAGALPLLYGMAEGIIVGATYEPAAPDAKPTPAVPAMGRRRTRLHEAVGYRPNGA